MSNNAVCSIWRLASAIVACSLFFFTSTCVINQNESDERVNTKCLEVGGSLVKSSPGYQCINFRGSI